MQRSAREWGMGTLVSRPGWQESTLDAHILPIYQSSLFVFPDTASATARFDGSQPGYIYSRLDNPNMRHLGKLYAQLEGMDLIQREPERDPAQLVGGLVFGSGMAAISAAILSRVEVGDVLIAQRSLYGGTFTFLEYEAPRRGLKVQWVEDNQLSSWEAVLKQNPGAKWVYAETPANPVMEVVDLAALAKIAHARGAWLMVDNTFATPYGQRPLSLGADVVVHSTTKYLAGHGVVIGGAVLTRHVKYLEDDLIPYRKRTGAVPSPFDAWLAALGLRTFELRMERHCANAMLVAEFLEGHPKVARVHYPGLESHPGHIVAADQMHAFSGTMSFELKQGFAAAERMLDSVALITLGVSLGSVDTLIVHPAATTHANVPPEVRRMMKISDGMVRLSVGIENEEDILADLAMALEAA